MRQERSKILSIVSAVICTALTIFTVTSCGNIYEELPPCPRGVNLRFVYDYNMEYANSFHKKVDCVTLFIYDEQGKLVTTRVEKSDVLQNEDYRMLIDLNLGKYQFVAYGGLACDEATFSFQNNIGEGSLLSENCLEMQHSGFTSNQKLHDLYYGKLDVTIDGDMYRDVALHMMKNTNNVRIVLQQLNGEPVYGEDFTISITDDNTLFAHDNSLLSNGDVVYSPWAQGTVSAGFMDEGESVKEVLVGYAEFSMSRLMSTNEPRLVIVRNDRGMEIVNISLNNYLLLLKSDLYTEMPKQEFLDRESEWSLVFFLDSKYEWSRTQIKINGWTVRLNSMEM